MSDQPFAPLEYRDGYLPIEDHGLIGDGTTAALVARDGTVNWLCIPRFDSEPLFCSLLDHRRGGAFTIRPEGLREARQYYLPETAVLVTEMRSGTGTVRVTDALTMHTGADLCEDYGPGRGELVRLVEVIDGDVRLHVTIEPRGGGEVEQRASGLRLRVPRRSDLDIQLDSSDGIDRLDGTYDLATGSRLDVALRWIGGGHRHHRSELRDVVEQTKESWRRWVRHVDYEGPHRDQVRRSAITLKLLDHFENGALVAAPTSSLPEAIGGVRNWDYRYAWIRDAAFSVYALRRAGLSAEAWGFLGWVLDATERHGHPCVLFTLDGDKPDNEHEDDELEGYRGSSPVRWGNAAADQRQNDTYGEILDCAWQWVAGGGKLGGPLWKRLVELLDAAADAWNKPDHGIWEVRTDGDVFTYSAAMCQVALDRGSRIAKRLDLPGDAERWRREADKIRKAILDEAWDPELNALTETLGDGGALDASILALPLRRVIPADHPKMVATVEAVTKHLSPGEGLLYRYDTDKSDDGLPGKEGAFLLCSFWLADNLAYQGRLDEANELFDSLCARTNPLGLLPEQIDPDTGAFLGNFPQAFSHVGLISTAENLARGGGGPSELTE
jgi:alpha,alpha-trehalase